VWVDALVGLALVAATFFVLTGGRDEPVAASAPTVVSAVEPAGPPTMPTTAPPPPATAAPAAAANGGAAACHPSYQGTCIPPNVADADCYGIGDNGPWFVREENIKVVGPDVFRLDVDFDGVACEANPGLHDR
jgi:hypothetical protein